MAFPVNTVTYHTIMVPGRDNRPEHNLRATVKEWNVLRSALMKLLDANAQNQGSFDKEIMLKDDSIEIDAHDGTYLHITASTINKDGQETFFLYDEWDDEWDIVLTRQQVEELIETIDSLN